jgi:hypothetical protein
LSRSTIGCSPNILKAREKNYQKCPNCYKAGQGKSCPNSVRGRKSRTPARFTTFDTAIYPECNPQSGAATLRGLAPLVRRPRFNKCALTGDSSPKETGGLGRFPGKTPLYFFLDKLTQRMTQGYLTDPATRQIYVCKQYTPFPWADAHFETGFELPAPSSSLHHYCIMSAPLPNLPQMAI